ncbi:hypothetical protein KL933_003003 [Ogataea haglerorum]|uniref:Acid phosphatase n=1 Tax=Ogataea haglerorum TaxID=1937702 RepID=A0AAN6D624_9ASCO|nr:uncharacterized protein KL911_000564 [Ogataea haglerorum]KAG7693554.1 hypothetical protein KL951_004575 [Ogataea haglerorum]KAG7725720.1 hypothetical protein KL948_004904 [Ogataea haglerorum]KAG7726720.1 hypothetical protein KL933_003003 [Ogataea haglerorum]KAG7741517.1 hypothetical protein KL923_000772 [Ogataea haglerorum]KAG7757588.1 hypothetical protein KL911_000564 [Ogataea haglerorum]
MLLFITLAAITAAEIVHHAPIENEFSDLDQVFNSSRGTNDGIYNSSYVPDSKYGQYNFCNMPHVRKDTYPQVDQSVYKLQFVEVIHRHHKRTPYAQNCFPVENLVLYCDDALNNYYSEFKTPDRSNNTTKISWTNYQNQYNPFSFIQNGYNGTCQFPQISYGGLEDSYQHGLDLYGVYGELLEFLPESYDPNQLTFRVTNNVITSQVVSAVAKAMYPCEKGIDVKVEGDSFDALEPTYSCDFADDVASEITSSSEWQEHLAKAADLYNELDHISGVDPDSEDWHQSFDHYFDNTAFRLCHGYDLACNSENSSLCMTQDQAEQIFRLGDFEYNYQFRIHENSTLYAATSYGAYFNELKHRLLQKTDGSSSLKYSHNVAHDGSIARILGFLQIDYLRWPGMGSEIVFELYEGLKDGKWYLRTLYMGRVLTTTGPLGEIDMIPLRDYVDYIESMIGKDAEVLVDYCS